MLERDGGREKESQSDREKKRTWTKRHKEMQKRIGVGGVTCTLREGKMEGRREGKRERESENSEKEDGRERD